MIRFFFTPLALLLRLLPRPLFRALGAGVGNLLCWLSPERKAIALKNIAAAFPELTEAQRAEMAKKSFQHHGHFLVETLEAIAWTKADFLNSVDIKGMEIVEAALQQKRGAIILGSHLGNWEIGILSFAARGMPLDIVVKGFSFRPMENFVKWYRSRTGARVLWESVPPTEFWKSFSQGRLVCFVLDQFMGPPIGIPVKFFGQEAGTAAGLALITERSEVPVIPVRCFRDDSGRLSAQFYPPLEFPNLSGKRTERLYQRTQIYNDAIEKNVRHEPSQWTWIHRRWKGFVGTPRWVSQAVFLFVVGLGMGCASNQMPSETGIPLPPDPQIAAPEVVEKVEASVEPVQVPAPVVPEAKKRKPKKKGTPTAAAETPKLLKVRSWDKLPFEVGEQQIIEGSWVGLPAGRATLEVRPGPEISGRKTLLLWGNALSSRLVDTILHIDNTLETFVDAQAVIPYKFLLHMVESFQTKETRVSFDHTKGKAFYWSKRFSKKYGDDYQDRQDPFVPLSQDLWSALFHLRLLDYELNKKELVPIYENGKNMVAELVPVANEIVRTKAGVFQTWKLAVELKLNNVLRPAGAMYMWISDDSKRYIVKFDIKLNLGSLAGELVSVRDRK